MLLEALLEIMLDVLAFIEFPRTVIYYGFYYSFIIGQFLVGISIEALQILILIMKMLTGGYFVLAESFNFFLRDMEQLSKTFLRFSTQLWREAENSISSTTRMISNSIEEVTLFISMLYSLLSNGFYTTVATIGVVILFCKQAVVLFGTSVWFVLTFIPFSVWNLICRISSFLEELHKMASEGISLKVFKNVFMFLTDMPVESAIGLVAAACIGYALNELYLTIFSVLYDELRDVILNICEKFQRRILPIQGPVQRQPPEPIQNRVSVRRPVNIQDRATAPSMITLRKRPLIREPNPPQISKDKTSEELYCVICQEHLKCILLLPCRHVCMCSECNSRLRLYTDTCPICRIQIESTMQIFL